METKVITKEDKLRNAKFIYHPRWGFVMLIEDVSENQVLVKWFGGSSRRLERSMVERDCDIISNDIELIQTIVSINYKRELELGLKANDKQCYLMMDDVYKFMKNDYSVNYLDIYRVIRNLFKRI